MQDIELKLTPEEVNLILAALAELPFKVSAPLLGKIKAQGDAAIAVRSENVETLKDGTHD